MQRAEGCRQVKAPTETDTVRAILEWLALRRVFAWRNNTTGVYDPTRKCFRKFTGMKGVSDILGVLPGGRLLAIEAKKKGGYPTPEQRAFIEAVNDAGGLAFVARSVDDVETRLIGIVA